jgi:hypothetical protein
MVGRLRHMAWNAPEGEPWVEALGDAADEIERLRVAGDALAQRLRWWTDDTDASYPDHEALRTWEKTRRG